MNGRFAIVDGYSTGQFLVQGLLEAGAECVHVASQSDMPAFFSAGHDPARYLHDLGYSPNPARTADQLRPLGVSAVLAGTESGVLLAEELTALLGTPGNAPVAAGARRRKPVMAATLCAAGVKAPRGLEVSSARAAGQWYDHEGISEAVVKPVDSAGADNVHFCGSSTEVEDAVTKVLGARNLYGASNATALVQERVVGPEFYANTVSIEGEHKVAELWRYTKHVGPGTSPLYDFEEPVAAGTVEYEQVAGHVHRALTALGIRNGAAHSEVILADSGPVLIETGARLGGGTLPWLVEAYCGVSQTRLLVDSLIDPEAFRAFDDKQVAFSAHVRNVSFVNPTAGVVRSDQWRAEVESLGSCVAVVPGVQAGQHLPATIGLATAPGFAYLVAPDVETVHKDYQLLRQWESNGLYTS